MDCLHPNRQLRVLHYAEGIRTMLESGTDKLAYRCWAAYEADADEKVALWDQFDSKQRSRLMKAKP